MVNVKVLGFLLALILLICGSFGNNDDFILLFPRNDEVLLVNQQLSLEVCFIFMMKPTVFVSLPSNQTNYYVASTQLGSVMAEFEFSEMYTSSMPLPESHRLCVEIATVDKMFALVLTFHIKNRSTGESIDVFERRFAIGTEDDVGLPPFDGFSNNTDQMDFIEIGTSYFDNCMNVYSRSCGRNDSPINYIQDHIPTGISLGLVDSFLTAVPSASTVQKYHMAIASNQSRATVMPVYAIIPSVLGKLPNVPPEMSSCAALNTVHPTITKWIAANEYSPYIIRKNWVRSMSIGSLLQAIEGVRIRLFKVDVEGMDIDIINGAIEFYRRQHQQQEATIDENMRIRWLSRPCMFYFRKIESSLAAKLEALGYKHLAPAASTVSFSSNNTAFVNCLCTLEDFAVISMYIMTNDGDTRISAADLRTSCKQENGR